MPLVVTRGEPRPPGGENPGPQLPLHLLHCPKSGKVEGSERAHFALRGAKCLVARQLGHRSTHRVAEVPLRAAPGSAGRRVFGASYWRRERAAKPDDLLAPSCAP